MDRYLRAALEEARQGLAEGGVPIGAVLHGENRTFMGEEALLRERGVSLEVRQE